MTNLVGFNFRLTEIGAAIGLSQIKKSETLIARREELANYLNKRLDSIDGLIVPKLRDGCRNVYYVWGAKLETEKLGLSNETIAEALNAEGCPTSFGYVEPLYNLPIFKKKIAIGSNGYPFNLSDISYEDSSINCPTVEHLHKNSMIEFHFAHIILKKTKLIKLQNAKRKYLKT